MSLKIGERECLNAEPRADCIGHLFQVTPERDERFLLDGPVAERREIPVEQAPSSERLGSLDNHGSLAAGGNELLQRHAVRDGEPPAFDQVQCLVHLGALGQCLCLRDVPDGEVVSLPLEAERTVVCVAFFADTGHVRFLRAETPCNHPAGGKLAENEIGFSEGQGTLPFVNPFPSRRTVRGNRIFEGRGC